MAALVTLSVVHLKRENTSDTGPELKDKCDIICENLPNGGTNNVSPGQMVPVMSGV